LNAAPVVNAQEFFNARESANSTNKVYRVAVLLIVALVYMVYISPMMRARAVTEKTAGMKATFRWVDLITKLVLVYLLALAATCNVTMASVMTLVFLLLSTPDRAPVVIESKGRGKKLEHMTGDEEDLDEGEDIDSDFEFKRVGDDFIFESDTPVFFPLNGAPLEASMADEVGDLYAKPGTVDGLIVDSVAESERIARAQGLGMDVLDRAGNEVHNVSGVDLEGDEGNMAPVVNENFESTGDCGCGGSKSNSKSEKANNGGDDEEVEVPKALADAIDEKVEKVAEEVEAEKKEEGKEVKVPAEAKDEVRRAVRVVAFRMGKDGKTVTRHDLLMISRMMYGQMFKCKGLLKVVMADAQARAGESQ
jgi:hypothetical protein